MSSFDSLQPRILLVDCDAFYVQVARLEDPDGAGRAEFLIVGGSASGRGVVTSASYACRAMGVRSAMPTGRALQLCPQATVAPVSRAACSARSRRVKAALVDLAPVVQAASIDEFYLDFTGTERLLRGEALEETADRVRREVFAASEIRVSVGGGVNRLVAKLAVGRAKPDGVFIVAPGDEADFVAELELARLPGVGPALLATLRDKGLHSVADVRRVDPAWLGRWLGESRAHWLRRRVFGEDDSRVTSREARKSVSSERTFSRDLNRTDELERELLRLTVSVAGAMRAEGLRARTLTVKIRDSDFKTRQRAHTFPEAVESEAVLYPTARELLSDLRRRRKTGTRLLGVGLTNFTERDSSRQLALFEQSGDPERESDRDRRLAHTVDRLRSRFGRDAVLPGRIVRGSSPTRNDDSSDPGTP
jgi:DNA polymerase-4